MRWPEVAVTVGRPRRGGRGDRLDAAEAVPVPTPLMAATVKV